MTKTYRNALVPVAAAFFALAANADSMDTTIPVAYPQDEPTVEVRTCSEALQDAAIFRELNRGEADIHVDAPVRECEEQKA